VLPTHALQGDGEINRAEVETLAADLFVVAGSSLVVYPAAGFPELAKRNGATLVIINREPTGLDPVADLVLNAPSAKPWGPRSAPTEPTGAAKQQAPSTRGSGVLSWWVVEQGGDATGGFCQPVWLHQEARPALPGSAGMADRGSENYANAGVMVGDPACKTDPVHGTRHIDVAEDQIDLCPAREDGNGLTRAGRFYNPIPGTS
jgi:hypothetical protein